MNVEEAVKQLFSTEPANRPYVESMLKKTYGDHPVYWLEEGWYSLGEAYQKAHEIKSQGAENYEKNTLEKMRIRVDKAVEKLTKAMNGSTDEEETEKVNTVADATPLIEEAFRAFEVMNRRMQKETRLCERLRNPDKHTEDNLIFEFLKTIGQTVEELNLPTIDCSGHSTRDIHELNHLRIPLSLYTAHKERIDSFDLFSDYKQALFKALDYVEGKEDNPIFTLLFECAGVYVTPGPIFWCLERPVINRLWENTRETQTWSIPLISYTHPVTGRYFVGDVGVPRDLFITNDISPREILTYDNVEMRAAMMEAVGVDELFEAFESELLDSIPEENYWLYSVEVGAERRQRILKMICPTDGQAHHEFVHPENNTVEEALAFRNRMELDENGKCPRPQILT